MRIIFFLCIAFSQACLGMEHNYQKQSLLSSKTIGSLLITSALAYNTFLQYSYCNSAPRTSNECLDASARVAASGFFTLISAATLIKPFIKQCPKATIRDS